MTPAIHPVVQAANDFLSQFKVPGTILVAVSGGSDSKGLLLALHEAMSRRDDFKFSLAACTIDHGLRPESADEARSVASFCRARGIRHDVATWDGDKPASGLQAAAREARYHLLATTAKTARALCIVTGHTADDQAETIAMRTARSAGLSPGLAGMADAVLVDATVWVLRPFLGLRRSQIRDYLLSREQGWLDDPSNDNPRFERVRVRQGRSGRGGDLSSEAANARFRAAEEGARFLSDHAFVHAGLVAHVDLSAVSRPISDAERRALLVLSAVLGGRPHLPPRETVSRIAGFLESGVLDRLTANRTVFDRRRDGLYLYREARGLSSMIVAPSTGVVWDNRFTVSNDGPVPLFVGPTGAIVPTHSGVPEAIAARVLKAAPHVSTAHVCWDEKVVPAPSAQAFRLQPLLRPFDTFLPRFDLIMANTVATLFGRDPYPELPVHDVLTEKKAWT